ncbi:transcriptional regulator, AsnC family [Fibrobacter sp. UWB15]|uniref:Lrp/AsnC family transcriptional regulator n=1 Tax=unclassified Fibrobacter TaxID=2634177 RepID=UPI00091D3926|nr:MULTISPECIES: Lrp/AsnC family transcriptional regulator [unclassified Fibrobacter]PWJ67874.1 AsnC family transcriptional regulator [Fibrobacter sp. UWB6]SHF80788.1 transcriptional regulator, AsnC family [Fibrobacter sp. UWB8]SMG15907.1 transcriptional regulator, AsnC family [Fibrobacter sp. UWB15]
MTELEQHLLAIIQDAFPLEEHPYLVLAEQLGSDEQSVFAAIENLRRSGIIRRIGGVYDSKALGFISRLCAGKVPSTVSGAADDSALEKFAAVVNVIPAITHNYVRSHEYNVWFTVMAQSEAEIQKIVDEVCANTELHDVHILSATEKFKINTVMKGAGAPANRIGDEKRHCEPKAKQSPAHFLSANDRARIRIACNDIPHTLTPFKDWDVSCDELREDLALRRMRRFGAILRHQEAGFAFNAMVCFAETVDSRQWSVDRNSVNPAGAILASKPYISHCYERPAFEGFPYTLYAMMHAQSAEDLDRYIKEAAKSIGKPDYAVLHSVRELKKTSFEFFA